MALKCIRSSIPVLNSISSSRFIEFYDYTAENINKNPTVLFVPGFNSSGHGLKSQAFIKHCQSKNLRYVCYDPEGLGESKIEDMATLNFQHWFEDAETAIKQCQSDKIVLVGSSMGGWISLKMANENPDKIQGLVLIAPAINFLRPYYEYWYNNIATPEIRKEQDAGKLSVLDSSYDLPISKSFVDKSVDMELDTSKPIEIKCSVKIIHGVQDETIPFRNSLEVMKMISNENVEVIFQKSGDHRLSTDTSLELILRSLDDMLSKIK